MKKTNITFNLNIMSIFNGADNQMPCTIFYIGYCYFFFYFTSIKLSHIFTFDFTETIFSKSSMSYGNTIQ